MKKSDWKDIAELVGIAAIVASLVFVGLQIKQTDVIASLETQEYAATRNMSLMNLMAEHADVWQRGCVGDELTPTERLVVAKIYWSYVTNNFAGWRRLQLAGFRDTSGQYQIDAFAANMHRYPGFREVHESLQAWNELLDDGTEGDTINRYFRLISEKADELRRLDPDPRYDVSWCGK